MFYCRYCSDTLEIIKNTKISNQDKIQVINNPEELLEIVMNDIELKKNKFINTDIQYSINWPESDITKLNLKESNKEIENDINTEDMQTMIINKYRQIVKSQKNISSFYLSCTNCATTYFLEPGTILDSINYERSIVSNDYDSKIRAHDPLLPRTKDFICPNSKCVSNIKKTDKKVLIEKEAVVFRNTKEYNVTYICCQCNTQWGT